MSSELYGGQGPVALENDQRAPLTIDPVPRERAARDELARLSALVSEQSAARRAALLELYSQLGTWAKVAEATGLELGTAYKAAR